MSFWLLSPYISKPASYFPMKEIISVPGDGTALLDVILMRLDHRVTSNAQRLRTFLSLSMWCLVRFLENCRLVTRKGKEKNCT